MQLSEMVTRASGRLNEGASGPVFYPRTELVAALNEAQRFWAMLTLCLETTAPWTVAAATTFTHMLTVFPDWIAPLRLTTSTGQKVRPVQLQELSSLDSRWLDSPGAPMRYVSAGADLVAIWKQPAGGGTVLRTTYARAPLPLVSDTDVPEIRPQYHPLLVEYAVYRVRQVEGGQEFAKVMECLNRYLDGAQAEGDYVRARNKGNQYDKMPFELQAFDRSKLLKMRKAEG